MQTFKDLHKFYLNFNAYVCKLIYRIFSVKHFFPNGYYKDDKIIRFVQTIKVEAVFAFSRRGSFLP